MWIASLLCTIAAEQVKCELKKARVSPPRKLLATLVATTEQEPTFRLWACASVLRKLTWTLSVIRPVARMQSKSK